MIVSHQRNRQAVSHPADVDDDMGRRFGYECAAQMRYHKRDYLTPHYAAEQSLYFGFALTLTRKGNLAGPLGMAERDGQGV